MQIEETPETGGEETVPGGGGEGDQDLGEAVPGEGGDTETGGGDLGGGDTEEE